MIDIKDLRDNPDKYRKGAKLKRIEVDFDAILKLDAQRSEAQKSFDQLRTEQNKASASIAKLKEPTEKKVAIARMGELKAQVKQAEEQVRAADAALEPLLLTVPQPPDSDVPEGKDSSDNVVLYRWGEPRKFNFKPKSHIELGEALDLFDFQRGVKLAGSRSYYLKGAGAELHFAILRMAMDMMTQEKGFTAMSVPVLVREVAMRGTGFFPAGREQAYRAGEPNETGEEERFLTGTAEVGLTAFHMDEVLDESTLPRKYVSVSTCFRREAGTYGKDTAGLYRVHQFDKCEQVVICRNDVNESKTWHHEMLSYAEEILKRLELPYRAIQCCTGDIGVKNASMIDLETWMPSRYDGREESTGYGETHSASRLYDFQARRLNLRYKDTQGKIHFCHTLNNTVVASPRILIPILENYQNADGSVSIPPILRPYMNGRAQISR